MLSSELHHAYSFLVVEQSDCNIIVIDFHQGIYINYT